MAENLDEILRTPRSCSRASGRCPCRSRCCARAGDEAPLRAVASHPFALAQCARVPARAPARGRRGGQHRRRRARAGLRAGRAPARSRRSPPRPSTGCAWSARGSRTSPAPSTRFVVLRSRCPAPTGRDRSFFVVTPRRDEPGCARPPAAGVLRARDQPHDDRVAPHARAARRVPLPDRVRGPRRRRPRARRRARPAALPGRDALPRLVPRGSRAPAPRAGGRRPPEAVEGYERMLEQVEA